MLLASTQDDQGLVSKSAYSARPSPHHTLGWWGERSIQNTWNQFFASYTLSVEGEAEFNSAVESASPKPAFLWFVWLANSFLVLG